MHRALIIALAVLGVGGCAGPEERVAPDTTRIDGVSARFEVASWLWRGTSLKVTAIYRNESENTVVFRCSMSAIYYSKIWRGSVDKTNCRMVCEIPAVELTLRPGEERRVPDKWPFGNKRCWEPGDYEIRFYYDLRLLRDPQLRARYANTHRVHDGYIPWESHAHKFVIK